MDLTPDEFETLKNLLLWNMHELNRYIDRGKPELKQERVAHLEKVSALFHKMNKGWCKRLTPSVVARRI
jgi:hypothetical protein